MAGGKKLDVKKLVERREKKLTMADKYYQKAKDLMAQAEELDERIHNVCDHPKEFLKLKFFTEEMPQSSMWLCTLCFQMVETKKKAKEKEKTLKSVEENIKEAKSNLKPKGTKKNPRRNAAIKIRKI